MHGDPKHPAVNPHPVKRYEVIATADAPGPWDSVKGMVFFDVVNESCVPSDSFTGGQNIPNTSHDIEMTRVDDKTWKGHFYRDALQDADYFELGVCHWDATGVTPIFITHGEQFSASTWVEVALRKGAQTTYFRKSDFLDSARTMDGLGTSSANANVVKNPDEFFPIAVTIKEATP